VTKLKLVSFVTVCLFATGYSLETLAQMSAAHSGPVMNYHRVDERLVTGGHLVGDGLAELQAQGVAVAIDLRDEPPSGQKEKYAEQGIKWINIPVEWRDPQPGDFEAFRAAMIAHDQDHVIVQCAANYRASAMTYLYRVIVAEVPEDVAARDMHAVWDPNENKVWRKYIENTKLAAEAD
jgi:protein tyrosine phosphatase (PTP) superfamily phosphohydrolase (DUF442 family)